MTESIGQRIKTIREWQGLSGGELSKKVGCTQAALSQYENGKRTPTLFHFRELCVALQIPYSMLLEGVTLPKDTGEIDEL